ncbi:MAG TPA: peptide ABC transporter substrate-binding protein [Tepidisphaeraceae bacterium]|nr:peptide ABC transporter substrate-binding protein [Tepidisphaeraceae bacterium]
MLRLLSIPLVLVLLLCGAMAWSGSATPPRAEFTFALGRDVLTLDPNRMSYGQDIRLAYGIWEGLYSYEPLTLEPIPGVARSCDVSADKKVYTFHLRDNARWSNGDRVTANDFVFAWRRMLESPGEYTYLHYYIKGAKPYLDAYQEYLSDPAKHPKPDFARMVGLEVPDPLTLRVTLDNPVTFFFELVAFSPFLPLHEPSMRPFARVDEKGHTTYDGKFTRPGVVGNGPYVLTGWDFKRSVRLTKSDTYWDKANVRTNTIEQLVVEDQLGQLLRYDSGDIDWLPEVPAEVAPEMLRNGRKDLHVFSGYGGFFLTVMVRPTFPDGSPNPLADLRVRQALSMAIDRQPIVKNITRMGEAPATTYIPPGILPDFEIKPGFDFDPKRARELLAESGKVVNGRLPGVTLMYRSGNPTSAAMCQSIVNGWRSILGVDVPLEQQESKTAKDRLKDKNYSIATANWFGDYPDASTFTDKYLSTAENNDSGWTNKEFDALCDQATREADAVKRYDLLERANRLIDVELPIIPLYVLSNQYLFRDNVHGINTNPRSTTMFKGVWVDRDAKQRRTATQQKDRASALQSEPQQPEPRPSSSRPRTSAGRFSPSHAIAQGRG